MDVNRECMRMLAAIRSESKLTAACTGKADFDQQVLDAMARVPRHDFVQPDEQALAYINVPLPIGHGQTISQPYIVALMTDLLEINPESIILEVGTGCGYQSAILAELAHKVYSLEIIKPLAQQARERLERLGYTNIEIRSADGNQGWPEHAPYDGIIVTAAAPSIPPLLLDQLKTGGNMVIPVNAKPFGQELLLIKKTQQGRIIRRHIISVSFVPLRTITDTVH